MNILPPAHNETLALVQGVFGNELPHVANPRMQQYGEVALLAGQTQKPPHLGEECVAIYNLSGHYGKPTYVIDCFTNAEWPDPQWCRYALTQQKGTYVSDVDPRPTRLFSPDYDAIKKALSYCSFGLEDANKEIARLQQAGELASEANRRQRIRTFLKGVVGSLHPSLWARY